MVTVVWFQHGDVAIFGAQIPENAHKSSQRILAKGEVTGHAHRLLDDADVDVYEHEGTLFLRVGKGGAGITHEEHGVGILPKGTYQVGQVQEYDHFAEEARAVRD